MRKALRGALEASGSKLSWNHITDQIGMFAYTGLTAENVDQLYKVTDRPHVAFLVRLPAHCTVFWTRQFRVQAPDPINHC